MNDIKTSYKKYVVAGLVLGFSMLIALTWREFVQKLMGRIGNELGINSGNSILLNLISSIVVTLIAVIIIYIISQYDPKTVNYTIRKTFPKIKKKEESNVYYNQNE